MSCIKKSFTGFKESALGVASKIQCPAKEMLCRVGEKKLVGRGYIAIYFKKHSMNIMRRID